MSRNVELSHADTATIAELLDHWMAEVERRLDKQWERILHLQQRIKQIEEIGLGWK